MQDKNFNDFGLEFQYDLFNQIIVDNKFGESIIDILDVEHFKIEAFKKIIQQIKAYYKKHNVILNFPNLKTQLSIDIPDETFKTQVLDTIKKIECRNSVNLNVKEYATKFCKMQNLKKVLNDINKKVEKGVIDDYDSIENKLRQSLTFKETNDPIDVFHDLDTVLSDEHRNPISTGINELDVVMNGGLSAPELALVIAPLGVGKTTFLTKVANQAYLDGHNVLHIFFEDKDKSIQRKHYTIFTGIELNELSAPGNRDIVINKLKNFYKVREENGLTNKLFLQKLPADGITVTHIKNLVKKLNAQGDKIDMLVIDYIDCIVLERERSLDVESEWSKQGLIMSILETAIEELNVACWTATQGDRESTKLEVVRVNNMGGGLKKAQKAHFIMSIGKTLEQKAAKVATISILKSRVGDDGIIFENCLFDNSLLKIDTKIKYTEQAFNENKKASAYKNLMEKYQSNSDNHN